MTGKKESEGFRRKGKKTKGHFDVSTDSSGVEFGVPITRIIPHHFWKRGLSDVQIGYLKPHLMKIMKAVGAQFGTLSQPTGRNWV